MFVITADQVASTRGPDLAGPALERLDRLFGPDLIRPADRSAGDEIQAATERPATALSIVLDLARTEQWSIGVGIGGVRHPVPEATRAMTGSAFVAARAAVERAKKRPTRFALDSAGGSARELDPVVGLLLELRRRRTPEGWEVADLLDDGLTQKQAAERLGISPQAVSLRALAAGLRLDAEAREAIATLLGRADADVTDEDRDTGGSEP